MIKKITMLMIALLLSLTFVSNNKKVSASSSGNEDIIKYGFSSIDWDNGTIEHNIPFNPIDGLELFVPQYTFVNNAELKYVGGELTFGIENGILSLILNLADADDSIPVVIFDLINNNIETDNILLLINSLYKNPYEAEHANLFFRWAISKSEFYFINNENNYIFLYRSGDFYNNVVFNSTITRNYKISRDFVDLLLYVDDILVYQDYDTIDNTAIMIKGKHDYFYHVLEDYTYSYVIKNVNFYINSNLIRLENNPSRESIIEFLVQTNQIESE